MSKSRNNKLLTVWEFHHCYHLIHAQCNRLASLPSFNSHFKVILSWLAPFTFLPPFSRGEPLGINGRSCMDAFPVTQPTVSKALSQTEHWVKHCLLISQDLIDMAVDTGQNVFPWPHGCKSVTLSIDWSRTVLKLCHTVHNLLFLDLVTSAQV